MLPVAYFLILSPLIFLTWVRSRTVTRHALVSVLGDIGRSPRMQYHTLSLLKSGYTVDLIGYQGTNPLNELVENSNLSIHFLNQPTSIGKVKSKWIYIILGLLRSVTQIVSLFFLLLSLRRPKFILIQNPPAIPTLFVFQIASFILNVPLVIDWHNFGFSLMEISRGSGDPIVKLATWYEKFLGRFASLHLTVTKAMAYELSTWPVRNAIVTIYDRPPNHFKKMTEEQQANFLSTLNFSDTQLQKQKKANTIFTTINPRDRKVSLTRNRPVLLVSSSSWTEDEDFSILLAALIIYDKKRQFDNTLPDIYMVITGKGPLKDYYMNQIMKSEMKYVKVFTAWLEPEDYPKLLGCALLGISLHTSSSGLDLPMKVVDMFGSGVPSLALHFACINELVHNDVNGYTFSDSTDLANRLFQLLPGFPVLNDTLALLREGVDEFKKNDWDTNWDKNLLPLLEKL